MKKRVILLLSGIVICFAILFSFQKNNNLKKKDTNTKSSLMAIMIKAEGATEYTKSSSNSIPIGDYVLNEEKTNCENGGKISDYNSATGELKMALIGTDKCYLYFDVETDKEKPVISNLKVNGSTITATLSDNKKLAGYGISTSNTTEPSSWTSISGTTYSLSTTISTKGTYYLWVKDAAGNKAVSDIIDLELYGWKTILLHNGNGATTVDAAKSYISGKGTPSFTSVSTTNDGLYAAVDDLGTSYYFRGAVNNNWVKFGQNSSGSYMYWRIIRINGDNSIRMIYTGTTAPTSSTSVVMTGTGTQVDISKFNTGYKYPEYLGYMYTLNQQHGHSYSSTIKTTLENWYAGTTLKDNEYVSKDQIFCNDRSAATGNYIEPGEVSNWSSRASTYYFGANYRLESNKNPKLKCPLDGDKFTATNSTVGNKLLTYPVGLLTSDEVAMAGGVYQTANRSFYLYTNQVYYTGSPSFFSSGSYAYQGAVSATGQVSIVAFVYNGSGTRPVISLIPEVVLSGNGTWSNPYIVS